MSRLMVTVMVITLGLALALSACSKPAPAPAPPPSPAAPGPAVKPAASPSPAAAPKPAPAPKAVSAADFYKQNTLTIVVGFAAGGGTDVAARVLTPFWPEVTGGKVEVKNMPGGGGILGSNTVYASRGDGLTLGVLSIASLTEADMFNDPACKYDMTKISYIGMYASEPQAFSVGAKLPYNSMADLQKAKGLKFGTAGRRHEMGTAMMINLFGLDGVAIPGYANSPEAGLAIARGELHGMLTSMGSIKDEVDKGFMKPALLTVGPERSALYPNAPAILEVVKPNAEQQVYVDIFMPTSRGRALFGPPGIPKDRLEFLSDALIKITTLPGYKDLAKQRWGVVDPTVPGPEVDKLVAKLGTISEADIAKFNKMVDSYVRK